MVASPQLALAQSDLIDAPRRLEGQLLGGRENTSVTATTRMLERKTGRDQKEDNGAPWSHLADRTWEKDNRVWHQAKDVECRHRAAMSTLKYWLCRKN